MQVENAPGVEKLREVRGVGFEPTQAYATGTSTLPL